MTPEQLKAEITRLEMQGHRVEAMQLGNEVYMHVDGDFYRLVELVWD